MGLADILTGMMNGPRGQRQPSSGGGGGMSPIIMALLGLLAYKALKGRGGQTAHPGGTDQRMPPGGTASAGTAGGGLDDILGGLFGGKPGSSGSGARPGGSLSDLFPGGLGGVLGGAAAGSVLSGGLGNLMKELQDNGHGRAAQSWVGTGPNHPVTPASLEKAAGADTLDALARETGIARDELLRRLTAELPHDVDKLTPQGRIPSEDEASV